MGRKMSPVPRRKRMKQDARLQNARSTKWVESYAGKDLVLGYRRRYGTDALTAVIELQRLGVSNLKEREAQIRKTIEQKAAASSALKQRRAKDEEWSLDSDDAFAYIAGYTPGGTPYGVTREEWEQIEHEET